MRMKKQPPDLLLFLTTLVLLSIGMVMVFSSSGVPEGGQGAFLHAVYYLKKQLIWAAVGIAAMLLVMNIDYFRVKKLALPILGVGVLLLILVLFADPTKGSSRWFNLGSMSFAPSELIKICLIFFIAVRLSVIGEEIQDPLRGFAPNVLILGMVVLLIMLQPDLGTAAVVAGTVFVMFFAAGSKLTHLGSLGGAGLVFLIVAIRFSEYRWERFISFLDPWASPRGAGFQIIQSLYALGSGGLLGVGLGRSHQKLFYLPEQNTDFIFSILGEELGYLGVIVVLTLFFVFIWRGLRVALICPDPFGRLLATGITSMIGIQAIINMMVASGSLPVTGITLPFISYGGSSLLFTMIGVGMLLNISRYSGSQ
ncbi:MAG: putative lipid II flippase FtsW [Firmicutes bacterium]|nr:putative lipid II flippase FtsW [Bacillota bacterium]